MLWRPSRRTDTQLLMISRKFGIMRGPRAVLQILRLGKFEGERSKFHTYTIGSKVITAVASAFRPCITESTDGIAFARELSSPGHRVRLIVLMAFNAETIRGSLGVEETILRMESTILLIVGVTSCRTMSVTLCKRLLKTSSAPP